MMPRLRTLAPLVLLAATARPCPAQAVTATSGNPGVIAAIHVELETAERELPTYRETRHHVHGFSLEGGELRGFFRGEELRKVSVRLYSEMWQGHEDYYFAEGRLIFARVIHERYRELFGTEGPRATVEHQFWFQDGEAIRHVRTQRPSPAWEDLSVYDRPADLVHRNARLFAGCAAAPAGPDAPECTAPEP